MRISIIIILLLLMNCTNRNYPISEEKECLKYFKFIKKDWTQSNDGVFNFKSINNYDDIFESSIYEDLKCIKNIKEQEVVFIFGEPTKSFSTNNGKVYIYCMQSPDCEQVNKLGNKKLTISFDENQLVKEMYFSPHPPNKG